MTSQGTDDALPVALETARGRRQGQVADRLWAATPAGMRLSRFHASTVPDQYRNAFVNSSDWRAGIDLSGLPARMRRELAWCVFQIIELGGKVPTPTLGMLARRLSEVIADLGAEAPASLTGLPAETWLREISLAVHRRTGQLPGTWSVKHLRGMLLRFLQLLAAAADDRPWWQREMWKPAEDARIPLRKHEPRRNDTLNFGRITVPWLRPGMQWHCKAALETGTLTWTSLHHRVEAAVVFDAFLAGREMCGPQLTGDPAQLRVLMLEFLGHLKAMRATRGRTIGQPVSAAHVKQTAVAIEQFYRFMHDNKDAAAAALTEPGWLRLGPQHTVFFRRGELPRPMLADPDADVIGDTAMSKIMAGIGVLGDPAEQDGFGDEQGMRIMMLQVRLGRRINEICLLDRDRRRARHGPGRRRSRRDHPGSAEVGRSLAGRARSGWRSPQIPIPGIAEEPPRGQALLPPHPAPTPERAGPAAGHPRWGRAASRLQPDPQVPAHPGHQPAQRRGSDPRRAAVSGAPDADHDDALRQDPGRDGRGGVPAVPQARRRRPRP